MTVSIKQYRCTEFLVNFLWSSSTSWPVILVTYASGPNWYTTLKFIKGRDQVGWSLLPLPWLSRTLNLWAQYSGFLISTVPEDTNKKDASRTFHSIHFPTVLLNCVHLAMLLRLFLLEKNIMMNFFSCRIEIRFCKISVRFQSWTEQSRSKTSDTNRHFDDFLW